MQVLSSLSGIPFYASSAGFAPTNSADVSAIASAYQVVSATATQLYAGTAYVTSVNDNPISASRAGNAANASLATSAYYDGTGRLISALPDSAAVSAIASSYAESAASSKLDNTASSSFYPADNPSGFLTAAYTPTFGYNTADQISSIDGSALGGMDEAAVSGIASAYAESAASGKLDASASSGFYPSDNPSGFISSVDLSDYATTAYVDSSVSSKLDATASSQFLTAVPAGYATTAYVDSSISAFAYESAVSGWTAKQDTLTFGYDTSDKISSIDGSALGGMDDAAVSGIASAYAESAVSSVSGNYYTTANESGFLTAQAQASWSESASASPSYIQGKPDLVDIVAGPGIHIDNPDGNTLRVSMAQNYETVLWENPGTSAVTSMTLSEDVRNFDRFRVYWLWNNSTDFVSRADEFSNFYTGTYHRAFNLDGLYIFNGTTYTVYSRFVLDTGYSSITYEYNNQNNDTAKYIVVNKIVGINRTASAQ